MRSVDSHQIQVIGGPLDQEPHHIFHLRGLEVERSCFRHQKLRSHEVPKLGIRDTWQNHTVVLGDRQADNGHILGEFNTLLTSHISRIHEIRVHELNPLSREFTSSENERRKFNITSRGFKRERCQGWTFKLTKAREARSASA
jgi:hypothetical protein